MAFPLIKTIDDILPHIAGKDNFCVNKKDDYIVIDYILNTPEYFQNSYEKECRGIIFHADGRIMARRLHKFFNLNERPETSIENIDFSKKHWILEKLDGSMITPIWTNGKYTWGSKAGVTFLTPQIEEFVKNNPEYDFFTYLLGSGFTPIFEWCSRQNRIVIDHPMDRLVLIAIRDNETGEYWSYESMKRLGDDIDVVKQFDGTVRNMQELSDTVKGMSGIEGFVVRFEDGQIVKIKSDEYCRYHRAKDDINLEKNVISILVNSQADDFRTLLQESDRIRFEEFEILFFLYLRSVARANQENVNQFRHANISKKDFALQYQNNYPSIVRSIYFKYLENDHILDVLNDMIEIIKKNAGSQSGIDKVRPLFGGLCWNNYK